MIGDSTMSIKAEDKRPETGWGEVFSLMLKDGVRVENKAKNGRSTRSFMEEKRWEEVCKNIQSGDYVLIQFGHNDEKIDKPSVGTTIEEYKNNLSLFVRQTQEKGGQPILLTSIARRNFVNSRLVDTHGRYPDAVRIVADSLGVPLIDLTLHTNKLLDSLGEAASQKLFLHLDPGQVNYPKGITDNTHLNEYGAAAVSDLVIEEIHRQRLPLRKYLK